MKIAIMQPYFFPYIGYFQLVDAVDKFIFYDDVNFIKNGWINRNKILINSTPAYITIQLKEASSFRLINQVEFTNNRSKIGKSIQMAYKKAQNFEQVWPLVNSVLIHETEKISELAIKSVTEVCEYLGIRTEFEISSKAYFETKNLERTERIISICKRTNAQAYYNLPGGIKLYSKDVFKENGLEIFFIKSCINNNKQFNNTFNPFLSIIDVIMHNPIELVKDMLTQYKLA